MSFEDTFTKWVGDSLKAPVPKSVKAFSLNLLELVSDDAAKFGVELIGSRKFDEKDSDWPCYEVWEPKQRMLAIPEAWSGPGWQDCLARMRTLVVGLIEVDHESISELMRSEGFGMGFVDGDLHILWKAD